MLSIWQVYFWRHLIFVRGHLINLLRLADGDAHRQFYETKTADTHSAYSTDGAFAPLPPLEVCNPSMTKPYQVPIYALNGWLSLMVKVIIEPSCPKLAARKSPLHIG